MSEIAQDLSTSAQIAAIEDNFLEYVRFFGRWRRVDLHENVGLLWLSSDIPYPVFNIVARTQLAPDKVDAAIEEVIARCKARNVPTLWITGPNTRPADLGVHLNAHGFAITGNPVGMAADLHSLPELDPAPPGLVVKLVTEMATLRQWIEVSNRVFERPDFAGQAFMDVFSSLGLGARFPLQHYIGWLNGEPVAASTLFMGAGVAGIYDVATVPEARQRGIGTAMTLTPLLEARARGYRVGVLHALALGIGVYHRLGFQDFCRFSNHVWSGAGNPA
jgi:GNAT superfamily N-acetyltransferase